MKSRGLRERNVSVRILTSSARTRYVDVHSLPETRRCRSNRASPVRSPTGPARRSPGHAIETLSLGSTHAKVFVADRQRVSSDEPLTAVAAPTEIGLIIESPSWRARLLCDSRSSRRRTATFLPGEADRFGERHLVWRTLENGTRMDFDQEPNVTFWQRLQIDMLSMLPLDGLL
jgi:hypothetical protein